MAVASIAVPPDPKRDAAAALLAQTAPWPRVTLTRQYGAFEPGTIFYRVPSRSQPARRHLANGVACQCCDYQKNGAICAHVRAVMLIEQRQAQPAPIRKPRGYEELFEACRDCGDLADGLDGRCSK